MKQTIFAMLFSFCALSVSAQHNVSWGDQGNGTYINPVLNADYSDPDVIRVGDKYYMVASDFHYMGMQVLESEDLVNWKIVSQIYRRLDYDGWNDNRHYGDGSWAPAIRFHNGKFYVYFCTPTEGLMMSTASDAHGPWAPLTCVLKVEKWEDPCPFWDEDGQAYLGHSKWGAGPIIIHKMSEDGTKLLDDGKTVYTGPVAEGTKIMKLNGYYYIIIPEGGVEKGWQTVLRSKDIYGPYEKKVVLEQGSTNINGPHQGALVDTPEGEWWFLHFQSTEPLGRVVHLEPAHWNGGWPVIGVDIDMNGIGEPVRVWTKPGVKKVVPISFPQTDDEFNGTSLGLQWQWNHNPYDASWSMSDRKGCLTLMALKALNIYMAHNSLTQKAMGYEGEAVTKMYIDRMEDGQRAGLICWGKIFNGIGVCRDKGKCSIYLELNGKLQIICTAKGNAVYFKVILDSRNNSHQLYYSFDNKKYVAAGAPYSLRTGFWKGVRVGLFSYNTLADAGKVSFDFFHYSFK